MKNLTILFTAIFCMQNIFAQVGSGDEVDVISKFKPTLKESDKITMQPSINDTFFITPNLTYGIDSRIINLKYQPDTIAAARLRGEPLKKLNRVLLKMGYGNYNSPLGEVTINSLRHKTTAYSFHYRHFSSTGQIKDAGFPGISDNILNFNFKNVLNGFTLHSNVGYERNGVHFYGFNTNDTTFAKSDIRQRFNQFKINLEAISNHGKDSSKWNHHYGVGAYTTDDIFGTRETSFKTSLNVNKFFKGQFIGARMGTWFYNSTSNLNPFNQFFFNINPYAVIGKPMWKLEVGINPYFVTEENASTFGLTPILYPKVWLDLNLYRHYIVFYTGVTGHTERNSFETLRRENPFIFMAAPNLRNSNHRYIFDMGFKGLISQQITYDAGINFRRVENLALFFNDTIRGVGNYFNVLYDNANILNLHGELAYQSTDKWHFKLKANWYNYQLDIQNEAWHRHTFDLTFSGRYNLSHKILLNTDFYLINARTAPLFDQSANPFNPVTVKLPAMADVNFGVEYRYSRYLSLFLNTNNVASSRFVRWNNYPTQRFNLIGGLTFAF